MALSSRSQLYPTTASFCTGLAQRQECCRCWIDALLQQWTHRSPSPQAQIGQVLDVWPCQTSSVTPTLAPCRLISTGSLSPDLFLLPFVLRLSPRASPFAHSSKYVDYLIFCVVRSKQAHYLWVGAKLLHFHILKLQQCLWC